MATIDRNTLKAWFQRGLKPLSTQFSAWIDSFWHKTDTIPIDNIANLQQSLNSKVSQDYVDNAIANSTASVVAIDTIRDGVDSAGNTLKKVYALITTLQSLVTSDDVNLDTVQEIVTFIKNNKDVIDSISTNKIDKTTINDNLLSTDTTKVLSANQGYIIKGLIDALTIVVGTKVEINSIVDNLTTTAINWPLSANQGKILKGLIDTLVTTVSGKQSTLEYTPENTSNKGAANGYVPLNASSKIDDSYLSSSFTVSMNFSSTTAYTFICPRAMSIDSSETNTSGATLTITKSGSSYTLGTALAKYDTLVITPSVIAFFNLTCTAL